MSSSARIKALMGAAAAGTLTDKGQPYTKGKNGVERRDTPKAEPTFDPIHPHSLPTFVCDYSLCRVAKSLRLLGYDVVCEPGITGEHIIHVARAQRRIVVTGSTRMLPQLAKLRKDDIEYKHGKPQPERLVVGYDSDGASMYDSDEDEDEAEEDYCMSYVKIHSSDKHEESMLKVLETLCLPWDESRVFTRCVDCNVLIESVPDKEKVRGLVPAGVFDIYSHFYNCPMCLKVYWGVDNGVAVNYKSVRTIEYLRQFRGVFANGGKGEEPAAPAASSSAAHASKSMEADCDESCSSSMAVTSSRAAGSLAGSEVRAANYSSFVLRRHFSSLPRGIKLKIFAFLERETILAIAVAVPTIKQLATAAANGEVFVPAMSSKQLKKEYRGRQLEGAKKSGQAPFCGPSN